jgi:hypothetical protein
LIGRDVTRARERSERSERRDRSIERRDDANDATARSNGATARRAPARRIEFASRDSLNCDCASTVDGEPWRTR